jgi:urea transport system substrate-binding protein
VRPDGEFEVLWSLTKPIRPIPYPATRTREEWDAFIDDLTSGWVGRKSGPAPDTGKGTAALQQALP